jgi:hypothetical protein
MRSESVYEVECLCGRIFETTSGDPFSCPKCGRILVVVLREPISVIKPKKEEHPACSATAATKN